jgi:hypothetical protein
MQANDHGRGDVLNTNSACAGFDHVPFPDPEIKLPVGTVRTSRRVLDMRIRRGIPAPRAGRRREQEKKGGEESSPPRPDPASPHRQWSAKRGVSHQQSYREK